MSRFLPSFILVCLTVFSGFAQSTGKIRGSRNVTTQTTEIKTFNKLIVEDDFRLNIRQGDKAAVEIDADDNLHAVIDFKVDDSGTLTFKKNQKITSSKSLDITVVFKDSLTSIELKESAQLTTLKSLKLKNLDLKTKESTKAFLKIEADTINFKTAGKSRTDLNITAKRITAEMNDNSHLKAFLNTTDIDFNLLQRANLKLAGTNTGALNIKADNFVILKGDLLKTKTCKIVTEGRTDIKIHVEESLEIDASGNTETDVFGTPKVTLNTFDDKAILRKK